MMMGASQVSTATYFRPAARAQSCLWAEYYRK
jgi:hypothetical protein